MIEDGTRVFVYRNLHKNLYSVRGSEGRIIAHTDNLMLRNVRYCVGKKGRERVLREKRKNVHAGLRGFVIHSIPDISNNDCLDLAVRITYNPYLFSSFVVEDDNSPIFESDFALLTYKNGKPVIYAINSPCSGNGPI